jgi:hypothetical protein
LVGRGVEEVELCESDESRATQHAEGERREKEREREGERGRDGRRYAKGESGKNTNDEKVLN